MNELLQKKIPTPRHYSYNIIDAIVSTVLTYVCVVAFKPSFISTISLADQFIIGAIISAVVLIVLLVKVAMVSKLQRSGRWNLKMDLITLFIEFFVIALILLALSPFVIKSWLKLPQPIDFNYVIVMIAFIHLIGFLLYFVSFSAKYVFYGSPAQNSTNPITISPEENEEKEISEEPIPEELIVEASTITIEGKNQGEKLVIEKDQLVCISTNGHYIEIYLIDDQESDGLKKVIFRNSILSIANSLIDHEEFIQCHRSHLINLNQVEKLTGSSKKMEAHMKNSALKIPVSRAKSALTKERTGL